MKTLTLSLCALLLISCNFHEVDPGKLYRSNQLTGKQFSKAIEKLGIKTIINLRGESPTKEWYQEESQVAEEYGVELINIKMRASHIPTKENLIKLLESFESAERPILIHCQAGADRTGEATAIYQMEYMGKSKKEALKMLTPRYLHLKKKYPAKRYFFKRYEGVEWAYNEYDPCSDEWEMFPKDLYCN